MITIRGPKGVGKSLALAAIDVHYRGSRPCLLFSPQTLTPGLFECYVEEVYKLEDNSKCLI